ncbi:MAG: GNAT family N-acetyltransferase [Lachnospiraceae bacterium]|nr:GNAT family N-acetyltransferase [Lachnospiraceae bacterium]
MDKEFYLENPCKASSLPFWKTNLVKIPDNMKVLLENDLQSIGVRGYFDERFFKLIHRMNDIEKPVLDNRYEMVCCEVSEYAKHIAGCYSDIGISTEALLDYQTHTVYDENLWIAVTEHGQNTIIASGIAEVDTGIKEGILEWIQVSPEYRGKGLGIFIVRELLWRMKDKADFVMVSGKVDNPTNPRDLYKACGFCGEEIWHVMRK